MTDSPVFPLTPKEKKVMEFLESYMQQNGFAPSFQEIQSHFGFKSINSIQNYLKQLEVKGYIQNPGGNKKRALTLLKSSQALQGQNSSSGGEEEWFRNIQEASALRLPMLGRVAAGQPIERMAFDEYLEVPSSLVRQADRSYALRVEGDSMIEDGIFEGDFLVVQQQDRALNGEIIVAVVENEATVKRFYSHSAESLLHQGRDPRKTIELRPANSQMTSFWYSPREVQIRGAVVSLIRQF